MKYVVRGAKPEETPVEVWVELDGNGAYLCAQKHGVTSTIGRLTEDGTLLRYTRISTSLGFKLDAEGRIVVEE